MSDEASFRGRGGFWVVMQFILMLAVLIVSLAFHGDWTRIWMTIAGAALLGVGGLFGMCGIRALGKSRTPFPRPKESSSLIRHGIYSRVRHPLYTCVMLLSPACALIWQSWPGVVIALALIPFFIAKARCEEQWLCEKFPDYAEYAKRVPRFFPRIRPPSTTT